MPIRLSSLFLRTLREDPADADIVVKDLKGITFDGETLYIPDKNRLR